MTTIERPPTETDAETVQTGEPAAVEDPSPSNIDALVQAGHSVVTATEQKDVTLEVGTAPQLRIRKLGGVLMNLARGVKERAKEGPANNALHKASWQEASMRRRVLGVEDQHELFEKRRQKHRQNPNNLL